VPYLMTVISGWRTRHRPSALSALISAVPFGTLML